MQTTENIKKRGRKPKFVVSNNDNNYSTNEISLNEKNRLEQHMELESELELEHELEPESEEDNKEENKLVNLENEIDNKAQIKKRGRKPKGGKILPAQIQISVESKEKKNIILHLKCTSKDIETFQNDSLHEINTFNNFSNLYDISNEPLNMNLCVETTSSILPEKNISNENSNSIKNIYNKIKDLELNLHYNKNINNKSACFWDTCEFNSPPIYIPKNIVNGMYHVYGCFCSPECASAYLLQEKIDDSVKYERYSLLNNLYSKIFLKNKINPAPDPRYVLNKFMGNLTIDEYRQHMQFGKQTLLVVDKPLTNIMPEIHKYNDNFIVSNNLIPQNNRNLYK